MIGWLQDPGNLDGSKGGAEYTADELKAAAPVDFLDCPPGNVGEADAYIVHNCWLYSEADLQRLRGKTVTRFIHDHRGPGPVDASDAAHRVFYSPLQREHCKLAGEVIPPPLDLDRFRPENGHERKGAVTVGTFGHYGKGPQLLAEWARQNGPLTVVGQGPCLPQGPNVENVGPVPQEDVPRVLWAFETFVHLPSEVEAFGRGVMEAWAAGCELVVNRNVGCLHWLETDPDAVETAAERFWELALS